jgi:hypothetical protein
MTTPRDELWIGLCELSGSAESPILKGSKGAYANYLAMCANRNDFRQAAESSARDVGLLLTNVEWSEPYWQRSERNEIDEYLRNLAGEVTRTGVGRYGLFHAWDTEG